MQPGKPSKVLTFFLSFVPGVGHLYLGAMNRGLQIMVIFFGSLFLLDFLRLGMFPFWLPIIWFYGLFDALQKADDHVNGEIVDEPLFEWQALKLKNVWLGWGFVVLGSYLLVDRHLGRLISQYLTISWYDLRSVITAVLLIAFGAFLLWGKKVKDDE